jgi:hypothetical protein
MEALRSGFRAVVCIATLAIAACDQPRSEAYSPEAEINFRPVTAVVTPAEMATKISGIARQRLLLGSANGLWTVSRERPPSASIV